MRRAPFIRKTHGLPELDQLGPELRHVARWQVTLSLLVPWLCLAIYVVAAVQDWWLPAVAGVVLLSFFTYGSISHDLVHSNLGLPQWRNDLALAATELLALRSGHAYQAAHLHHHACYPSDDDVEGAASGMSFGRSLIEGLILQPRCCLWAMRHRRGPQGWIRAEVFCVILLIILSLAALPWTPIPAVYVALVIAGSWIIPLVTSYIPHHRAGQTPLQQTRMFRGWLFSLIAIEHLYHLEHHLYPEVPHHHWAELARRLDPYLQQAGVRAIRWGRGTRD